MRFIVLHDTGNPNARAQAHARWYRNDPNPPLSKVSSAHLFVDDMDIVETLPAFDEPEQALHVLYNRPRDNELYGYDANRAAIGVEYCYGSAIDADKAYDNYIWTIAALCHHHGLDPARDVVGHQILDPGRKTDPGQGLRVSGRSYEKLLDDVVATYRNLGGGDADIGTRRIRLGGAMTTVNLRRRAQPRTTDSATLEIMRPGKAVEIAEVVTGERVSGNADWCRLAAGGFAWSGGLTAIASEAGTVLPIPGAEDAATVGSSIAARAVALAEAEWALFGSQTYEDSDTLAHRGRREAEAAPYWERVGAYWLEGTNTHGLDGRDIDSPWSATFISWVLRKAGAGTRFRYSTQHSIYISQSIRDRVNNRAEGAYWGYRLAEHKPRLGDLVCWTRGTAGVSYDNQMGGDYKSHTDLIVEVGAKSVQVIGGNVGNSVTKRPLPLDQRGFLKPVTAGGEVLFAVMECRLP